MPRKMFWEEGLTTAAVLAIAAVLLGARPAQADSWTPDHDGNGFNNSFERAVDIGELNQTGVNIKEQLGAVPWGFDTRDFYRFLFPSGVNDFQLSVKLDEQPTATMWINIYDQTRKLVYVSIGAADETFSIPLASGLYFLEVLTSREVANGRNLQYTLSAKVVEIKLPERGGTACAGAPDVGALSGQGRVIEGNLDERKPRSFYSFHVPYGPDLGADMDGVGPSSKYNVSVFDRLTGNQIAFPNLTTRILLDPGFYCLKIESKGAAGFGNYRGRFTAFQSLPEPGTNVQAAHGVAEMELGNLSENGKYVRSRYLYYQEVPPPSLPEFITYERQYVLRDWVGTARRTHYYWFRARGATRVKIRLYNLMASARAFIEDADGNILAASVVDSSSPNPDLLPSQSLTAVLPATQRRYYLRVTYVSNAQPGTSYAIHMVGSPP